MMVVAAAVFTRLELGRMMVVAAAVFTRLKLGRMMVAAVFTNDWS